MNVDQGSHYGLVSLGESIKETVTHVAFSAPNDASIARLCTQQPIFASLGPARDTKYAVSGESQSGLFYLDPRLPWLGIDIIDARSISAALQTAYKWDSIPTVSAASTGKMPKYPITYKSQPELWKQLRITEGAESDGYRNRRFLWHCRI